MIGRVYRAGARLRSARQRFATRKGADVLFFAAWWLDETWIRSTALEAARRGLRVVLAVTGAPGARERAIVDEYRGAGAIVCAPVDAGTLRALRAEVVLSATSGLRRDAFHPEVRRLVHMPHSLVSLHMVYTADSFDGFDTLFACGPHHVAEFERLSELRGLPGRSVAAVGYGKLDLFGALPELAPRHVLVGPSWGEKNILNTLGAELVDGLLARGFSVTVRPHPMFVQNRDPAWLAIRERFTGRAGFVAEDSMQGDGAIRAAGVLVTDYSGIAFEYAALRRRRTVFVDVPKKVLNPGWSRTGLEPVEVGLRSRIGAVVPPQAEQVLAAVVECVEQPAERPAMDAAVASFLVNQGSCGRAAFDALATLEASRA